MNVLIGRILLCSLALTVGCNPHKRESINHMNKGIEFANQRAYSTAIKELDDAISIDPENHAAAYTLAQIHIQQNHWKEAKDALIAAVKYHDTDPMYQYQLGHAYYEIDKYSEAKEALDRAIKLEPRLYKAFYFLGMAEIAQGHPKEAAAAWTQSAILNPGFGKPFFELGKLYFLWDFYEQAIAVLLAGSENVRDNVDSSDILYQLGRAYKQTDQLDKSIGAWEKAIQVRKGDMPSRLELGLAYAVKGDKDKARKMLEEFVKSGGGESAVGLQAANDRLMKLAIE